jgi:hypothetical protein
MICTLAFGFSFRCVKLSGTHLHYCCSFLHDCSFLIKSTHSRQLHKTFAPFSPFKAQWLLYAAPGLKYKNSTFCTHSVFMCFVWISEQTAIISLYSINWLVFITETESVYCAVRTGSLNIRSAHSVYLCVLCGSQNK